MPNELPIPPELQHLIEKREGDDRRQVDEAEAPETDEATAPAPSAERRQKQGRRSDDE